MKRSIRVVGVVLGLAGMVAIAPPASAHRSKSSTTSLVTFHDREPGGFLIPTGPDETDSFDGQIETSRECTRNRTVAVYKVGAANSYVSTTTDVDGAWSILKEDPPAGDYYAQVETKRTRKRGHRHICLAGRSETIEI